MNAPCKVEDCTTPRKQRSPYCSMHAGRITRHGSPDGKARRATLQERIMARVPHDSDPGSCWIWTGHLNMYGYAVLRGRVGNILGHRAVYEILVGPIPEGAMLDHVCHTPACVNPSHLRPVTAKQNVENFSGLRANNTSGYRGVTFHRHSGLWHAVAKHRGRTHSGGYFKTAEEAGEAARELRLRLHSHNDLDRVAV